MQLATLEAAITFLQQQTQPEGSSPQPGSDESDDTDDSAPAAGALSSASTVQSVGSLSI